MTATPEPLFRTEPPFNQEDGATIPDGYIILAEFPAVQWGWEGDMYFWILRDPSGRKCLGTSSHGRFHEVKPEERLKAQISELEAFIAATRQGLEMLGETTEEVGTSPVPDGKWQAEWASINDDGSFSLGLVRDSNPDEGEVGQ